MNIQKKRTFRDIFKQNKQKNVENNEENTEIIDDYFDISDDEEIVVCDTSKTKKPIPLPKLTISEGITPTKYEEPEHRRILEKKTAEYWIDPSIPSDDPIPQDRVSANTGNALTFKKHYAEMKELVSMLQPIEDKKKKNPYNASPWFNLKEVMLLGRVATPPEEMAGYFMCEVSAIHRELKNRESPFSIIYNKAAAQIKATLRGTQIDMALSGSEAMLKWVGSNVLGQADRTEHYKFTEDMSDEELNKKLALLEQSIQRISNG